jgi:hypothetical protein
MLISSALGAVAMVLFAQPSIPQQAVASGLGIAGVLSAHSKPTGGGSTKLTSGGSGGNTDMGPNSDNLQKQDKNITDAGKILCIGTLLLFVGLTFLDSYKLELGIFIGVAFTIASGVIVFFKSKVDQKKPSTQQKKFFRAIDL